MKNYNELLEHMARAYQNWISDFEIEILDSDEIEVRLEAGLDSSRIWTYKDFWDASAFIVSSREQVNFKGAGFVPWFDSEDNSGPSFAVSSRSASDTDQSCYSEVVVLCDECVDEEDPECEFCEGELEVRYDLAADGTFEMAG